MNAALCIQGIVILFRHTFFEIPVYRLCEAKYKLERERYIEKSLENPHYDRKKEMYEFWGRNPDAKVSYFEHMKKRFGGSWKFNEIIGYICLCVDGSRILGEYWETDSLRKFRTRKKLFVYKTYKLGVEISLAGLDTNEKIYNEIINYLSHQKKSMKNRYIDTRAFEKIGPYINWIGYVKNA